MDRYYSSYVSYAAVLLVAFLVPFICSCAGKRELTWQDKKIMEEYRLQAIQRDKLLGAWRIEDDQAKLIERDCKQRKDFQKLNPYDIQHICNTVGANLLYYVEFLPNGLMKKGWKSVCRWNLISSKKFSFYYIGQEDAALIGGLVAVREMEFQIIEDVLILQEMIKIHKTGVSATFDFEITYRLK